MNAQSTMNSAATQESERSGLASIWPLLVAMGVGLILVGVAAIGSAFIATLTTMVVFGILLLAGSMIQILTALTGRSWRGFFLHLLAGVLYFVAGVFMVAAPVEAAVGLTLLIAASLLVGGILRIVLSLMEQFNGWGWLLFSGVISILLGMSIWREWPYSGIWVIGLFVGIEMIFAGVSWVTLGLAVRRFSREPLPS